MGDPVRTRGICPDCKVFSFDLEAHRKYHEIFKEKVKFKLGVK